MRRDASEIAFSDQRSAVSTGARSDVDDPIRRAHHVFVVLDHDHGVTDVRESAKRCDESIVVALVKSDGGLIEHVANADEPRANLRCQSNALSFAARERGTRTVEREVLKSDRREEPESRLDLFQNRCCDLSLFFREFKRLRGRERARNRHRSKIRNRQRHGAALHFDCERFGPQSSPHAGWAGLLAHERHQSFAHGFALGICRATLQMRQNAFPFEVERNTRCVASPHQRLTNLRWQFLVRRVDVDLCMNAETSQRTRVVDVHAPTILPPRKNRFAQRFRHVWDAKFFVELVHRAEARAGRARTLRRIEAEETRLKFFEGALRVIGA